MNDAELWGELRRRLPAARAQLEQCLGNIPGSGGAGSKGGHSDRTGIIATALASGDSDDVAARDMRDLDAIEARIIRRMELHVPVTRDLAVLTDLVARWTPTRQQLARIADGPGTTTGDDGCVSCAKVPDSQGRPTWNAQEVGKLCKDCYDILKRVRVREQYRDAVTVPPVVIRWRRSRSARKLTNEILDDLLSGKLVVP